MKLGAIYMASGQGRRFGGNKLLHQLGRRPLYQQGFRQIQEALSVLASAGELEYKLVVVSAYEEILAWCRQEGAMVQENRKAAEGIAASVRLGIQMAGSVDAYVFFVADQPLLRSSTIRAFLSGWSCSGKALGSVRAGERRGNPGIFASSFQDELLALRGDSGGGAILRRYPGDIWYYEVSPEELWDIDTLRDAAVLEKYVAQAKEL